MGPDAAAVAVVTWLAREAMVARVVIGVAREALAVATAPPATVVATLPVTVPRLDMPAETRTHTHTQASHTHSGRAQTHTCESDRVAPGAHLWLP